MAELIENVMKLKDMIFTDGRILTYQHERDSLVVEFVDYSDHQLQIVFRGNVSFEENDSIGYYLSDSKLSELNGVKTLQLFDDENHCVFAVNFQTCEINMITKSQNTP